MNKKVYVTPHMEIAILKVETVMNEHSSMHFNSASSDCGLKGGNSGYSGDSRSKYRDEDYAESGNDFGSLW